VTIATAGIVERGDAGNAAEERAGLGGERVEEEVVDGCDYELRSVLGGVGCRFWDEHT
jgi:hypothetical protein